MKLNEMTNEIIDKFFDSLSEDELNDLWHKYDKYSENENAVLIEN